MSWELTAQSIQEIQLEAKREVLDELEREKLFNLDEPEAYYDFRAKTLGENVK
jgi:hypothetical protein